MSESITAAFDNELASGKLRIAELEREAIERSGDAAKELRVQLDRYQALVMSIAQVIWTCDAHGQMVDEQPSWGAYTGQTFEEYQGLGWLEAVHVDDRPDTLALWNGTVSQRASHQLEHRLRRHDGSYRYFSISAVPVYGRDGAVREWAGIHTDITQRRLTEESLRDGERRFRELADAMPQIVWGARPDGVADYFNERWFEFTGRSERTLTDPRSEIVHPEDFDESMAKWKTALQSGEPYEVEYRLRRKDWQYRWHLARCVPIRDAAGTITRWLGTCTDIHERRKTEEQLRVSARRLIQSNRELEDFATVASHDLQEPLRKIQSFVGCLREDHLAVPDDEGRYFLERIQNAASRMTTLVEDLLEFSCVSSKGKAFFAVDLNEVVAGVLSDLETRLSQTQAKIEVGPLPTVASDSVQMRQLLQNLIGNALKFHRKGVPPIVRLSAEILDGHDPKGRENPTASCRLSVADNGIGFDEKYLDRVFTIFQRLHGRGEYEGTGIGLAVCRRIAERHGGTITAHSTLGVGSTFVVTLPLFQSDGQIA